MMSTRGPLCGVCDGMLVCNFDGVLYSFEEDAVQQVRIFPELKRIDH